MEAIAADGDTIFALSTAGLPSAIAIFRLSGAESGAALEKLAGSLPEPRRATVSLLKDDTGEAVDRAIVLWLPGPNTVTGEDMAEFHIHGSRAVAAKMAEILGELPSLRAAEAGEFTRRAFFNGRMDLSEAEGLGDLLEAETEAQRRQAMAMAEGGLARAIADWRERLLAAEARLEAVLNFSDEGDVEEGDEAFALNVAAAVRSEIVEALEAPPAERLRDGIRVVLAGPPNAGKSTLFNALAAREAAIVSPTAGTTRDVIEAPVDIGGIPFVLSDTAGLRESDDAIEDEGVRRARSVSGQADIVLWLGPDDDRPDGAHVVQLWPKSDVSGAGEGEGIAVSAATGDGMTALREEILRIAKDLLPRDGQVALNGRQRTALRLAAKHLEAVEAGDWILLVEALRAARAELDRLSGHGGVEDMLDALFGKFCIGK